MRVKFRSENAAGKGFKIFSTDLVDKFVDRHLRISPYPRLFLGCERFARFLCSFAKHLIYMITDFVKRKHNVICDETA